MAETMSIHDRIRSLNLAQVHVGPNALPRPVNHKPPPPPPPPPRPAVSHSYSTSNQSLRPQEHHASNVGNLPSGDGIPPPRMEPKRSPPVLPPRPSTPKRILPASGQAPPPPLPSRSSQDGKSISRRTSIESTLSTASAHSSISGMSCLTTTTSASRTPSSDHRTNFRVPSYDRATLPPIPSRPEKRPAFVPRHSSPSPSRALGEARAPTQSSHLLDGRDINVALDNTSRRSSLETRQPRSEMPKKSALEYCLQMSNAKTSPAPLRRTSVTPTINIQDDENAPPPVPLASRPNMQASTLLSSVPIVTACLKCRDFSAPDAHAARFPREAIPSHDIAWLAHELTNPFPSATDKARAIFTWLHHNVAYNVEAFFSGVRQPGTPAYVLQTGLAVCEGYAAMFAALATHAGLESVVVNGHGKGFGHSPVLPGQTVPAFKSNHAWNVVKIDNGEWKLVEPCWGAGYLEDEKKYTKAFSPRHFTMDNEEFGLRHFPTDRNHFFRADGRRPSWEDYMIGPDGPGDDVTVYKGCVDEHGLRDSTFLPRKKHIQVTGVQPTTRVQFQFEKVCEHWDNEKMGKGKPYIFILAVGGKGGKKKDYVPFQTNGTYWWVDVSVEELGSPGQTVPLWAVTTLAGKDGRGLTLKEFKEANGRKAMSFGGVASWSLL